MIERLERLIVKMGPWFDEYHWLHYHSAKDPDGRQKTDGFGDAPFHTCFYLAGLIFYLGFDKKAFTNGLEIYREAFMSGLLERIGFHEDEHPYKLIRHPRTLAPKEKGITKIIQSILILFTRSKKIPVWQGLNPDQMHPLMFVCSFFKPKWAEDVYRHNKRNYNLAFRWHHWMYYRRLRQKETWYIVRLICDLLEYPDTWMDDYKQKADSIMRSYLRLKTAEIFQPTFITTRLLSKYSNGYLVQTFTRYHTRKFEGRDDPPPAHLSWILFWDKEMAEREKDADSEVAES